MAGIFEWLRPTESYVTCRGRDDGGGAQVMACASAMVYARLCGLTYAHSPLCAVAHAPEGRDPASWAAEWESFFALGHGEVAAADVEARGLPVLAVAKPHRHRPRSRCLQVVAHCHKLTDRHPQAWAALAPALRAKYDSAPKPPLPPDPAGTIRLSLHVRRGDVTPGGRFAERFTADAEILRRVEGLLEALGPARERVVTRLFSQGPPENFAAYARIGAELHLDTDPFTTFHQLVRSEVCVLAKSTFSWLAGLIGGGLCLYDPFWHPPLPGWLGFAGLDRLPPAELARRVTMVAAQPMNSGRR